MKRIFHAACLALLVATSLSQPVVAQPQSATTWTLDRTATHEGLSSPVDMAYDAIAISTWRTGLRAP